MMLFRRARRVSYEWSHQSTHKTKYLDISKHLRYDKNGHPFAGGSYSDIHVGTCKVIDRGKVKVAVKCLRIFHAQNPIMAKVIKKELCVWSSLSHTNILPLLGYSLEENSFPMLISEFMENGTVLQYVKCHREHDKIQLILGIAKGVGYLHDNGIIHSNLKSVNVLISDLGEPLVCDFGISRMSSICESLGGYGARAQSNYGSARGSSRWMSPELLSPSENQPSSYTEESDIWAFGMIIYELLTRRRPYHELMLDPQAIFAIVDGRLPVRPESFENWPSRYKNFWELCEACWSRDPAARPRMNLTTSRLKARFVHAGAIEKGSKNANARKHRPSTDARCLKTSDVKKANTDESRVRDASNNELPEDIFSEVEHMNRPHNHSFQELFVHHDPNSLSATNGRPRRPVACNSCRKARRRCVRPQTTPPMPCEYCTVHRKQCTTNRNV